MLKRLLAMLLVVLFACAACFLTACNGDDDNSSGGNVSGNADDFPLEVKDWGGVEITILTHNLHDWAVSEVAPESLNDEPVNDAFFQRNAKIEETFGIKLVCEGVDNQTEGVDKVRLSCQSGLDEYQAAIFGLTYISTLGVEGLLYDVATIPNGYIHYNDEWWDQTAIRDMTINDKIFFLLGDAIVEDDQSTWAVYFNKDLVEKYGLENPYDLVREKTWTIDAMHEMTKKVHHMHGSQMSYDPSVGDVWGMVAQSYDYYAFMLGCGQPMIDMSGEVPTMRIDEEENIQAFMDVYELLLDSDNVGVADFFGRWDSGVYGQETTIFTSGNALFMPGTINSVFGEAMKNAEIKYGIIPMPMRNSGQQENYTTSVSVYWCPAISIPTSNVEKLDATCYALEAMAFYGKKLVTPEYYDRTLSYKRFKDDESLEMLDLIFRNRTYDIGAIFDFTTGANGSGMLYFYTSLLGAKSDGIMSAFEAKQESFQGGIDALIERCYK